MVPFVTIAYFAENRRNSREHCETHGHQGQTTITGLEVEYTSMVITSVYRKFHNMQYCEHSNAIGLKIDGDGKMCQDNDPDQQSALLVDIIAFDPNGSEVAITHEDIENMAQNLGDTRHDIRRAMHTFGGKDGSCCYNRSSVRCSKAEEEDRRGVHHTNERYRLSKTIGFSTNPRLVQMLALDNARSWETRHLSAT